MNNSCDRHYEDEDKCIGANHAILDLLTVIESDITTSHADRLAALEQIEREIADIKQSMIK